MPIGTDLITSLATKFGTNVEGDETENIDKIPYQQLVGRLLHLSNTKRLYTAFCMVNLSRFMQKPSLPPFKAANHMVRYLKSSVTLEVTYKRNSRDEFVGYRDSDWTKEKPAFKSISGYFFMLKGGPVTRRSKKKKTVPQSSVEAEYRALAFAARGALWIRNFFASIPIYNGFLRFLIKEDNKGFISLAKNGLVNDRTKHIDITYQMTMDNIKECKIFLEYVPTSLMAADVFTKALTGCNTTSLWIWGMKQ